MTQIRKYRARHTALVALGAMVGTIFLIGEISAQGQGWQFEGSVDPITDKADAFAGIELPDGSTIGFFCRKGLPLEQFVVNVTTRYGDNATVGSGDVVWRIDNGSERAEKWSASPLRTAGGVINYGKPAHDFARAIASAQRRIAFRNVNGTAIFVVTGASEAISQLFKFCGLPS